MTETVNGLSPKEYHANWRAANQEKVAAAQKRYFSSSKGKANTARAGKRAKPRIRRRELLKKYGLTPETFSELIGKQLNACGICKRQMTMRIGQPNTLNVDHDHATGKVRGLLCGNCNRMIGLGRDDLKVLQGAVMYLEGFVDGDEIDGTDDILDDLDFDEDEHI